MLERGGSKVCELGSATVLLRSTICFVKLFAFAIQIRSGRRCPSDLSRPHRPRISLRSSALVSGGARTRQSRCDYGATDGFDSPRGQTAHWCGGNKCPGGFAVAWRRPAQPSDGPPVTERYC